MTIPSRQKAKPTDQIKDSGTLTKRSSDPIRADVILKLKVQHAVRAIHGKEGVSGSRIQFGFTKRMEAISELEKIGMNAPSADIRKSVEEGLTWGSSDPAQPISAAAMKAMENIKQ